MKTKTGRANINFHNVDCMDFMRDKDDNYYELAIVDIPYGINVNMNAGKRKGEKDRYIKKNWDNEIPDVSYFNELRRVSLNQIVWGCNYFNGFLWSAGRISWYKNPGTDNDYSDCELAMHTFNNRVTHVNIPWSGFIRPKEEIGKTRIHPTQKPVQLYKWLLKNYAKEGDKIFDSHSGSASIALACWDMKYDLDLCELDKDYFDASWKRFEIHTSQTQLF